MKAYSLRNQTLAIAAGTLIFAFSASADDDKMKMDTNKDGMISAAEHDAGVRSKWTKMDPDGDGRVSESAPSRPRSRWGFPPAPRWGQCWRSPSAAHCRPRRS